MNLFKVIHLTQRDYQHVCCRDLERRTYSRKRGFECFEAVTISRLTGVKQKHRDFNDERTLAQSWLNVLRHNSLPDLHEAIAQGLS